MNNIVLKKWTWPKPREYNGFTGEERIRGWQWVWVLRDLGILLKYPKHCSICDSTGSVSYHSENYYYPEQAHLVCKSCHMKIHKRFREPEIFTELIQQYAVNGKEDAWFTQLHLERFDLAASLRTQFGEQITDLYQGLVDRGMVFKETIGQMDS